MEWKYETKDQKEARQKMWHKWFAWYPVAQDGRGFWLTTIYRRSVRNSGWTLSWEYTKGIKALL